MSKIVKKIYVEIICLIVIILIIILSVCEGLRNFNGILVSQGHVCFVGIQMLQGVYVLAFVILNMKPNLSASHTLVPPKFLW